MIDSLIDRMGKVFVVVGEKGAGKTMLARRMTASGRSLYTVYSPFASGFTEGAERYISPGLELLAVDEWHPTKRELVRLKLAIESGELTVERKGQNPACVPLPTLVFFCNSLPDGAELRSATIIRLCAAGVEQR